MNGNDGVNYKINVTENLVATFQKINKTVINTINTLEIFKDIRLDSQINQVSTLAKSFFSMGRGINKAQQAFKSFVPNINFMAQDISLEGTERIATALNNLAEPFEKLNKISPKQMENLTRSFGGFVSMLNMIVFNTDLEKIDDLRLCFKKLALGLQAFQVLDITNLNKATKSVSNFLPMLSVAIKNYDTQGMYNFQVGLQGFTMILERLQTLDSSNLNSISKSLNKLFPVIEKFSKLDLSNGKLSNFFSDNFINNLSPISETLKNTTNTIQKLNREVQKFEKLNSRISKQPNLLQSIFGGATSFAGYSINLVHLARQIIDFTNKSFEASRNQANAELQINVVLNNKGLGKQFNEIKKKAEELQSAGIFRNDVILAGASRLSTYLSTTEAITKMMGILANYATGMSGGKAVDTQQMIAYATTLTRMLNGSLLELSRTNLKMSDAQKAILKDKATEAQYVQVLGENYKNLSKEMMKVEVIGQVINKSWKDLYTTMSDTPFGKWEQLKNAFTNIIKEVGNRLIPAVNSFFDVILKNIPLIKEGFLKFAELLSSFIGTISIITEGVFNLFSFISSFLDLIPKPLLSIIGIIMAIVIAFQSLMVIVGLFSALFVTLSNPIVFAIAAIVVGISLVINYLNKAQNKSINVMGVIAGAIYALWTILKNVIGWVLDLFKPFIEYLVNCWENPEKAFEAFCENLSAWWDDTWANIVDIVGEAIDKIIDELVDLIDGINSNPLSLLLGIPAKLGLSVASYALNNIKEVHQKATNAYVSDLRKQASKHRANAEKISADNDLLTIPRIPQKDIGEAYKEAYDWASKFTDNFGQKMKGIEDNIYDDDDINDLVNNTGSMAKTADNINDKLNVMEDDLKYLRDFAEREIINNHITSDVNVEMINNNNISSELDIDGVLNSLTRKLDEQLRIQANGIYNY